MFARVRIIVAAVYLFLVVLVFVGLAYADPGWAEGGIPLVVVGLPWSIAVLLIAAGISTIPAVGKIIATEGGNFLMFVVVCGGLNAALILGASKVLRLMRESLLTRMLILTVVAALVGVVQVVMPHIQRDALERSRPQNVSKDAVHVGGAIGWWQYCTYDPVREVDICHIWNRGGLVLEEGTFVPYDGGPPSKTDALQIADVNNGPSEIDLRNGRILIPKAREAELRRFLDRATGKHQAR
jgi:hypothetical protein